MTSYLAPHSSIFITLFFGIICISSTRSTPSYYQRRQVSVFTRHVRPEKQDYLKFENVGNECPETEPWPCRTAGQCLSFDFICDGIEHCEDGFDERPVMCRAKKRPAKSHVEIFIRKYKRYFIPKVFGNHKISYIAKWLTEAKNINDFSEIMGLDKDQYETLDTLMKSAVIGRYIELELLNFPLTMWPSFHFLFGRIANSGFVRDPDTGQWL